MGSGLRLVVVISASEPLIQIRQTPASSLILGFPFTFADEFFGRCGLG